MSIIAANLQAVEATIEAAVQAVGRTRSEVQLLAVSKTFPVEAVLEAMAAGQAAFGENYLQEALAPTSYESHGGDDVGVWARGPGSEAVRGSIEQNTIFHFMLQSMPALRSKFCAVGGCDANGVPVGLPAPARYLRGR